MRALDLLILAAALVASLCWGASSASAASEASKAAGGSGSVGATVGFMWIDVAQANTRRSAWTGGLRAEFLVAEVSAGRIRAELATFHAKVGGSTETVAVDTSYHAAMIMGSGGIRLGPLEPYVSTGPGIWLTRTTTTIEGAKSSTAGFRPGVAALVGIRGAGVLIPRIEGGFVARPGRSAWVASVGLAWPWGSASP